MAGHNGSGRKFRNFAPIPNSAIEMIPDIGPQTFCIFAYLVYRASRDTDKTWPSYTRMELDLNISRPMIAKGIKTLERLGWISKERRPGTSSVYKINFQVVNDVNYFPEEVVNQVNSGSKPGELQVVNQVNLNNNQLTKTKEQNKYLLLWKNFLSGTLISGRVLETAKAATPHVDLEEDTFNLISAKEEDSQLLENRIGQVWARHLVGISPTIKVRFTHEMPGS